MRTSHIFTPSADIFAEAPVLEPAPRVSVLPLTDGEMADWLVRSARGEAMPAETTLRLFARHHADMGDAAARALLDLGRALDRLREVVW